jgi:hypothetical protein
MNQLAPAPDPIINKLKNEEIKRHSLPSFAIGQEANFFNELAADPLGLANRKVDDYPEEIRNHSLFQSLIFGWLTSDPKKASLWIAAQPTPWTAKFLNVFAQSVAERLPEAGLELLKAMHSPGKYPAFETLLINQLPLISSEFGEVLDPKSTLFPISRRADILELWAKTDGKLALEFSQKLDISTSDRDRLLVAAVNSAPNKVLESIIQSDLAGESNFELVFKALAGHSPELVRAWVKFHPEHPAAAQAYAELLEAQIGGGPGVAFQLDTLPETWRPFAGALTAFDTSNLKDSAQLISASIGDVENVVPKNSWLELSVKTAKRYGEQDSKGALAWADSLPPEYRGPALSAAAEAAAAVDPPAVSEWLNTVAPSVERDEAIMHLVKQIPDDPDAALRWSLHIVSPSLRTEAYSLALAEWQRLYPGSQPPSGLQETNPPSQK